MTKLRMNGKRKERSGNCIVSRDVKISRHSAQRKQAQMVEA